jgi:glutamyl-tRNA reductase
MPLVALGLNHQTAPLALRELVAFAPEATPDALKRLTANGGISEAAILSTCNRTELYCHVAVGEEAAPRSWLHEHFNLSTQHLDGFLYHHQGAEAARHMFRVATGLDSMVLGEPQILGQLKTAYQQAHDAGSLSSVLDRMFQNAFSVAKRARTETRAGIGTLAALDQHQAHDHGADQHMTYQHDCVKRSHQPVAALQMLKNSATCSDAPPISPPSISCIAKRSFALDALTLPP